ncbi:TPA: hypothetical protein DD690_03565 [Candidatus Daviesbacteria bacterium]|nr:MAG: hypothetical protein A3D02_03180 [Candidatus Daviesbacteria bacterium RIFCSPHIGHO2_02_FULL_39_41]OGE45771.1 MAG: hypothetical protein A3E67_03375 [Candidatus Daviesbacteria bacterium RIFCSPHIGHO2_12_FULL_38_25]OGE68986.1 MAG: hypothetical protein A3H81_03485 [Candidatus Daviesbacteria bacterium RIFCSPLOWO2_02_FULL_38_18]HBQ51034.1 hypothetical protein [Candidatus Daviesbacteria bacterium]HCB23173.1 hypothetical protein [Candidatus Daviesbacteria bacterium]
MIKLLDPKTFIAKNQPVFVYDIHKSWEQVVKEGPIWKSGKFPPLSKEKKYKFLGQKLISPIAISAGPASTKIWTDFYFKMGYGLVFEKTRRTIPRKSNTAPNIAIVKLDHPVTRENLNQKLEATMEDSDWEKYKCMTNSFGNPSPAMPDWTKELAKQRKGVGDGQLLGCSVTATLHSGATMEDAALDLLMAAAAAAISGVQVLEFNLACPNVTENSVEGEMFQDEKLVAYILREFKKRFPEIPCGFKFGVFQSKQQMKKVFMAAGDNLDYVSGINAIAMTVLGKKGEEILPGRRTSGVCGKADQTIALEHIKWASEIRKEEGLKYEILGGGGIVEVADVDRYLSTGADMVQVAAAALANPLLAYKYRLFYDKI